jgi:hypothetical protein
MVALRECNHDLVLVMIEWADPLARVSKHFNVREAIWLPRWQRLAGGTELSPDIQNNLVAFLARMDAVRDWFGKAINVHVTYRTFSYNQLVGGAPASRHMQGHAMDMDVAGVDCGIAISRILDGDMLDKWDLRCENNVVNGNPPGWIHLDSCAVGPSGSRYFVP